MFAPISVSAESWEKEWVCEREREIFRCFGEPYFGRKQKRQAHDKL